MQTFRVDIDLPGDGKLTDFLDTLSEFGSPRIVSYDAAPDAVGAHRGGGLGRCPTMVLEFTSYEDAVTFAQEWFDESVEDAVEYVETVTL